MTEAVSAARPFKRDHNHPRNRDSCHRIDRCSFTSDFDRGRAGYSPDHVDALVWALSELMVEPTPGWGIIEWTRLEAEKAAAEQGANCKPTEPLSLTNGGVRMTNTAGVSTAYGLSGAQYNADAEGIFKHQVGRR